MREQDHNCAIITKGNDLVGIFTDRDLLRKVVDAPETWDPPIDNVIIRRHFVAANRPAYEALDLMDKEHFRNVPVVASSGKVIGNLTHHAIIKYLAGRFPELVYNLPPQPNQVSGKRGGA